jgi:glutamate racemase
MKKIGFFDSGMGGLTVLKEALTQLPCEHFVYFADSLNAPYGNKPKEEIKRLTLDAVEFMAQQDLKALVIACNTATSVAVEDLRKIYTFPVLGMEPAVKPAVCHVSTTPKRVLVFATELTLKEAKFKNLISVIDTQQQVDYVPLQELVTIAETFQFEEKTIIPYLQEKLKPFELDDYGAMVLGCTHFPYFKNYFRKIIPDNIQLIDGSKGTVKHLINLLGEDINTKGNSEISYYLSKQPASHQLFDRYLSLLDDGLITYHT